MPRPHEVVRKGVEVNVIEYAAQGLGPYAIATRLREDHGIKISDDAVRRYLDTVPEKAIGWARAAGDKVVGERVLAYQDEIRVLYDDLKREYAILKRKFLDDDLSVRDQLQISKELDVLRNRMLTVMDRGMTLDKVTGAGQVSSAGGTHIENAFIQVGLDDLQQIAKEADKKRNAYDRRIERTKPPEVIDVQSPDLPQSDSSEKESDQGE